MWGFHEVDSIDEECPLIHKNANIIGNVHGESAATVDAKLRMMTWLQGAKM